MCCKKSIVYLIMFISALVISTVVGSSSAQCYSITDKKSIIIESGHSCKIKTDPNGKYKYKSRKTDVARVSSKGWIKARKTGSTTVEVKDSVTNKTAKISVNIIDECKARTLKKKKSVDIKEITDLSSLKWVSRDPGIVSVKDNKTLVAGKKKGTAYIEGCSNKGKTDVVLLKVIVGTPTSKIKQKELMHTLTVGEKKNIEYKVYPAGASYKKVSFEPKKQGIVSFDKNGVMTALSPGEVEVAIKAKDGCSEDTFDVEVYADVNRTTVYGPVHGTIINTSCLAWFGIPYAKPPVGELRWRAPQDPLPWSDVLNTTERRSKAAQVVSGGSTAGSEDCLYLNIYGPNTIETGLPVIVYIHGGSNITGSATKSFKNLASSANCIVVAVEFRLGAFGWLNLDALKTGDPAEDSGNFALLDIKKALEWVRANIGEFGGNPSNITLAGFSAGGRNVLASIISPVMKGLFDKAIIFSGGMTTSKVDGAKKSAEDKLASLLVKKGAFDNKETAVEWIKDDAFKKDVRTVLYSLTTDEVASLYTYMGLKMSNFPQLFEDGYVIPDGGFEAVSKGTYNVVPMIFGSSSQEFATYSLSSTYFSKTVNYYNSLRKGWDMLGMINNARKYGSMYQSFYYIENNTAKFAANPAQPPIYAYRFDWGNDPAVTGDFYANYIGSAHGIDVNFLCGSYKNDFEGRVTSLYTPENQKGRKELSSFMQSYISNFIRTGNPNGNGKAIWNPWTVNPEANKVMVFTASPETNQSAMTSVQYSREYIDSIIKTTLSEEQQEILYDHVLAGRYFMPEDSTTSMPDEESNGTVEDIIDITDTE